MKVSEILSLINAGYTKAEIEAFETSEEKAPEAKAPEVEQPEAKAPEVKAPEVKTEVKAPEVKAPETSSNYLVMTEKQLETLAQKLAVNTATGDVEIPNVNDKLSDVLASLMKGEN